MNRLRISIVLAAAVQALAPVAEAGCGNERGLGPSRCDGLAEAAKPSVFSVPDALETMDMDASGADGSLMHATQKGALLQYDMSDSKNTVSTYKESRDIGAPQVVKISFNDTAFADSPFRMYDGVFLDLTANEANQDVPVIDANKATFNGNELTVKMNYREFEKFEASQGFIISDPNGMS